MDILNAKMEKAVKLLFFDHLNDKQIAKQCNIAVSTLYGWKKRPKFQETIRDYGNQQRNQSYAKLESGSDKAVNTLINLMDSNNENIKLKASIELLKLLKVDNPPTIIDSKQENTAKEINQFLTIITKNITNQTSEK